MSQREPEVLDRLEPKTSHGDPAHVAHIVMKDDQMRGYVAGQPIEALCGKKWVPSRDYTGLPVCEQCTAEKERILAGMTGMN